VIGKIRIHDDDFPKKVEKIGIGASATVSSYKQANGNLIAGKKFKLKLFNGSVHDQEKLKKVC
jgi:hypothetical protein